MKYNIGGNIVEMSPEHAVKWNNGTITVGECHQCTLDIDGETVTLDRVFDAYYYPQYYASLSNAEAVPV